MFEITLFYNGNFRFLPSLFSVTSTFTFERSLCYAEVKGSLEVSVASRGMWLHIRGCNVLLIGRYVCGGGSLL